MKSGPAVPTTDTGANRRAASVKYVADPPRPSVLTPNGVRTSSRVIVPATSTGQGLWGGVTRPQFYGGSGVVFVGHHVTSAAWLHPSTRETPFRPRAPDRPSYSRP